MAVHNMNNDTDLDDNFTELSISPSSVIPPVRTSAGHVDQAAIMGSRTPCAAACSAADEVGVRDGSQQQFIVSVTQAEKHTNVQFVCGNDIDDSVSGQRVVESVTGCEDESRAELENNVDTMDGSSSNTSLSVTDESKQRVQREVSFASGHSGSSSSGFASDSFSCSSSCGSIGNSSNTGSDSSASDFSVVKTAQPNRKTLHAKRRINQSAGKLNTVPRDSSNQTGSVAGNLSILQHYVPSCLEKYGFCVVDSFLGSDLSQAIATEVRSHYERGQFVDGLLTNKKFNSKGIRGDQVYWLEDENDSHFVNVRKLLTVCDNVFRKINGRLKPYTITSRTKAMMACYPGEGRGYRQHIDNPSEDGRCVTCIYYLNANWDAEKDGGLLRLCPTSLKDKSIDLEPQLDRLLLFWSDHRTPHEVLPAFRERYAVTIWYFDDEERQRARERLAQQESPEDEHAGPNEPNEADRDDDSRKSQPVS